MVEEKERKEKKRKEKGFDDAAHLGLDKIVVVIVVDSLHQFEEEEEEEKREINGAFDVSCTTTTRETNLPRRDATSRGSGRKPRE